MLFVNMLLGKRCDITKTNYYCAFLSGVELNESSSPPRIAAVSRPHSASLSKCMAKIAIVHKTTTAHIMMFTFASSLSPPMSLLATTFSVLACDARSRYLAAVSVILLLILNFGVGCSINIQSAQ